MTIGAERERVGSTPNDGKHTRLVPGLAATLGIAVVATCAGRVLPVVGAPVIGILMGVAVGAPLRARFPMQPGAALAGRRLLQVAVVTLGFQLSLRQVAHTGLESLPVMAGTLTACLTLAALLGRRLGVGRDLRTLIGVGTGICGASAIAAISPVIRARNRDISYAISTIFLFNVAAVLTFPLVGRLLGLSQSAFGLFAGTAVNDTSSVIAAAASFGSAASSHAVVVKLTRTLMIVPISLVLSESTRRRSAAPDTSPAVRRVLGLIPWFLVGFLLAAAANSAGLVPESWHAALASTSTVLITAALSAVGLSTDVRGIRAAGYRPLVLGLALWLAVSASSLLMQAFVA